MRRKRMTAICMSAVMSASMMMSMSAMADEEVIAVPYQQESAWDDLALVNDDTVTTGVNIRSTASEDSQVIGCLYQGGAAWVINRGEEWTEVYSGGLTGFVKNEYLVYGEAASALAQNHGQEGVATTWDDVNVYASGDGNSEVLASLAYGETMLLAQDDGHWLQVQNGADSTVYVSAEDVSRVLLLDTAVSTGVTEAASGSSEGAGEDSYSESSSGETYYDEGTYEDTYEDTGYYGDTSEDTYEDTSYYGYTYEDTGSYEETYEDYGYTPDTEYYEDTSYTDYSDTSYSETYSETSVTDTVTETSAPSLPAGIGYYDEYTGTYYDYYGNAVYTGTATLGYYDEYTGDYYDVYGNWMFNIPLTGSSASSSETASETTVPQTEATYQESYTEETYTEETYVEETEAPATEASSTASADDTSLLAALIYCEAGNQSYEGMVAVGAVVMNRVASSSFPSTISDVIYQSGQFTPAYSGALASALANGVPSTCYEAAAAALNGENPVGSALYFNTGSGSGVKIGAHQFY